ncbi:MAG: hypothetical protein IPK11_02790 [Ignavibacteria bacterium]|nr:hypothetical protein [Ignavibacteria bacterium]
MPIQELLKNQNDLINYDEICKKYKWILQKNQYCVLSPDSDGLLCGLFMSAFLNWKVVGFYDGKVSIINKEYIDKNPIFLDIEIFRKEIRSMGHHMLMVNKKHLPEAWENFDNCIQPNNIRRYDGKNNFRLKYPLATIHMLISIVSYKNRNISIPESAIPPLFFTDGVFNILFSYPENVLNWLKFLRIHEEWNPLKSIFENEKYTVFTLMQEMDNFFRKRDAISIKNERGDRLRISDKQGLPVNIENGYSGNCHINSSAKDRIISFINILSDLTTWKYKSTGWQCWENMKFSQFTKRDFKSDKKSITIQNFKEFIEKSPLSWAMTSGDNIEYTLEHPDKLLTS